MTDKVTIEFLRDLYSTNFHYSLNVIYEIIIEVCLK